MKKENSKKGKINKRKETQPVSLIDGRFFPCRSNEEVLQALVTILHPSVRVEVAGGIVRHGW